MSYTEALAHREPLIVSTVTKTGQPHSNIMLSLGVFDNKILIGLCFLTTTYENLINNNSVCLTTLGSKGYYRIKGTVEMFEKGKYFDLATSLSRPPMPKRAILVSITEVYDWEKEKFITLT